MVDDALTRLRGLWPGPLLSFTLFYVVGSTLFILALANTSIANAMFIGSTSPVFAALLAPWLLGERLGPRTWLAGAAALLGVYLMAGRDAAGLFRPNLGDLAAVGVAVAFAGQMMAARRYRDQNSNVVSAAT